MSKAKLENRKGVDYLTFTPKGFKFPTTLPVITKGNRDTLKAWTWNGDFEKPTLRPSIRTKYHKDGKDVVIHYWLNDGICKCLPDCTDGNENNELELETIVENCCTTAISKWHLFADKEPNDYEDIIVKNADGECKLTKWKYSFYKSNVEEKMKWKSWEDACM